MLLWGLLYCMFFYFYFFLFFGYWPWYLSLLFLFPFLFPFLSFSSYTERWEGVRRVNYNLTLQKLNE